MRLLHPLPSLCLLSIATIFVCCIENPNAPLPLLIGNTFNDSQSVVVQRQKRWVGFAVNALNLGFGATCLGMSIYAMTNCGDILGVSNGYKGNLNLCQKRDLMKNLGEQLNTTVQRALTLEVVTGAKEMAIKDLYDETVRARDNLDRFSNLTYEIAVMVKVLRRNFIGNMSTEAENLEEKLELHNAMELVIDAQAYSDPAKVPTVPVIAASVALSIHLSWFAYTYWPRSAMNYANIETVLVSSGGKGGWKIGMNMHSNDLFLLKQTKASAKQMGISQEATPDLKKLYKLDLQNMDVDSFKGKMFLAKNVEFMKFLEKLGATGDLGDKVKKDFIKLSPKEQKAVMREAGKLKADRFFELVNPDSPDALPLKSVANKAMLKNQLLKTTQVEIKASKSSWGKVKSFVKHKWTNVKSWYNARALAASNKFNPPKTWVGKKMASLNARLPFRNFRGVTASLFKSSLPHLGKLMNVAGMAFCAYGTYDTVKNAYKSHADFDKASTKLEEYQEKANNLIGKFENNMEYMKSEVVDKLRPQIVFLRSLLHGDISEWNDLPLSDDGCKEKLKNCNEDQTLHVMADEEFDYVEGTNSTVEPCSATIEICKELLEKLEAIKVYGEKIPSLADRALHANVLEQFSTAWSLFPTDAEIRTAASNESSAEPLKKIAEKMQKVNARFENMEPQLLRIKESLRDSITVKVGVEHDKSMEILVALTSNGFTEFDVVQAIGEHFPDLDVFDDIYPVRCVREGKINSQEELVQFMNTQEVMSVALKNSMNMAVMLKEKSIDEVISLVKMINALDPLVANMDQSTFLRYMATANPSIKEVTFQGTTFKLVASDPLKCPN